MKVMYVITGLHKGGAEGQLLELSGRMKQRGHQLEVVTALPASGYAPDIEALGIKVHSLEIALGSLNPLALPRFAKLVWQMRPHVVHSMMVHANLLTRLARLISPAPVVVNTALGVSESTSPEHSSRPRELAYTVTDWLSDTTTQVSEVCAARYVEVRAVPSRKIRVVPCGVDATKFRRFDDAGRAAARREFSVEGEFVWMTVGRLVTDKDQRTMIEAFALLKKQAPNCSLVIKGIGALEAQLRAQVAEAGLGDSVRFLTERVAIERLLNTAHAFVLSSVREGMPTALLEAAACELPVVATRVGGNPEVVADGLSGYVVPPSDPHAMAQAMLGVMRLSTEERAGMGQAGRRLVEKQYDFEIVTTQYEQLYGELLRKKGISLQVQ
jgi:glycosyltransferase involved in cell wall biosynthesis